MTSLLVMFPWRTCSFRCWMSVPYRAMETKHSGVNQMLWRLSRPWALPFCLKRKKCNVSTFTNKLGYCRTDCDACMECAHPHSLCTYVWVFTGAPELWRCREHSGVEVIWKSQKKTTSVNVLNTCSKQYCSIIIRTEQINKKDRERE